MKGISRATSHVLFFANMLKNKMNTCMSFVHAKWEDWEFFFRDQCGTCSLRPSVSRCKSWKRDRDSVIATYFQSDWWLGSWLRPIQWAIPASDTWLFQVNAKIPEYYAAIYAFYAENKPTTHRTHRTLCVGELFSVIIGTQSCTRWPMDRH